MADRTRKIIHIERMLRILVSQSETMDGADAPSPLSEALSAEAKPPSRLTICEAYPLGRSAPKGAAALSSAVMPFMPR